MYDRNHDMKIDRTELLAVLKMMVGDNIHDDQIAMIADHTIGELVKDFHHSNVFSMLFFDFFLRIKTEINRSPSKNFVKLSNELKRRIK